MGLGLPFLKMLVDLSQYRGTRELFNNRSIVNKSEFDDFISSNYQIVFLCGDVKVNPGPNCKQNEAFSVSHWNLDIISAHNFAELHLLKAS